MTVRRNESRVEDGEGKNLAVEVIDREKGVDSGYLNEVKREMGSLLPEDGGDIGVEGSVDNDPVKDYLSEKLEDRTKEKIPLASWEGYKYWKGLVQEIREDTSVNILVREGTIALLWAAYAFEVLNQLGSKVADGLNDKFSSKEVVDRYVAAEKELDK
ncbi:hypothetical protein ISR94_03925 [Candidatus Microgenomates bacterium]|nr:hypothetical protein [Candidatus Microgenomates bacterium]